MKQRVVQAFARQGLPSPTLVEGCDAAIDWLEQHACAVCLLDYDLPGDNGLHNLARLHQRHPDLPVILISGAGSEAIAVAAFRSGVRDYIPKDPGYATTVAQDVRYLLQLDTSNQLPQPIVVGPDVSTRLHQPTYQNRMRVIGREMDLSEFHTVSLWEVVGGFLVRGTRSSRRLPEALEFLDRNFPQLVAVTARGDGERRQRTGELSPTGYEDLLRSIGRRLDETRAEAITLCELSESIVVTGLSRVDGAEHTALASFEWVLGAEDIHNILDDAYRLRETKHVQQPGLLRRLARI